MSCSQLNVLRPDLALIANWINAGSQVLDIGCGDGVMLDYLQKDKACTGYGIEINDICILNCVARNVSVIQQNVESGLTMFNNDAFDVVLCLSALQMVKDVAGILKEIARVGREITVSFSNFAYWKYRIAVLNGRMPVSKFVPYKWYDTPNLRYATIKDFESLVQDIGLNVVERVALYNGISVTLFPGWRANVVVFRLRKNNLDKVHL